MVENKPLLNTLRGRVTHPPPVWLMRQAGRYLPEYRAFRKRAGDFLNLCYTPELAAEVSLQPVHRFGFDATIVFSDILLVPQALGCDLAFVDGQGPRLSPVTGPSAISNLHCADEVTDALAPVYDTLRILRREQPESATLIGFAGSPWTVATYMIAGTSTLGQEPALAFMKQYPGAFRQLLDRLVDATVIHLSEQIKAGAEVVKLFDSWAGTLAGKDFDDAVVTPNLRITDSIKTSFPDTPVILFPRGAGLRYAGFANESAIDCLAIDQTVNTDWAATHLQSGSCLQGNLEPSLLVSGGKQLVDETRRIVSSLSGGLHVFNLGHGITPDARIENVELMLETVRSS